MPSGDGFTRGVPALRRIGLECRLSLNDGILKQIAPEEFATQRD